MIRPPAHHRRLLRALTASARDHGLTLDLIDLDERPWSSATFTGSRLTLAVVVTGDAAGWFAALPEEDLPVPGHVVADLAIRGTGVPALIEVLLLEA